MDWDRWTRTEKKRWLAGNVSNLLIQTFSLSCHWIKRNVIVFQTSSLSFRNCRPLLLSSGSESMDWFDKRLQFLYFHMWNSEENALAFLLGHPPPSQNRSAGDKSSKQLPLLREGPMKWNLFVLTHVLHATIFILPIQESLKLRVNRTPGRDASSRSD